MERKAKIGDRIYIIHLYGEDNNYDDRNGIVEHIDCMGYLHGTWGSLAVIPDVDYFVILEPSDVL